MPELKSYSTCNVNVNLYMIKERIGYTHNGIKHTHVRIEYTHDTIRYTHDRIGYTHDRIGYMINAKPHKRSSR